MAKEILLLSGEEIILKHQCTIRFQGVLVLTNKRVMFSKDGLGKSFMNTGSALLTIIGGVASKELSVPLDHIQAVGGIGNSGGFQFLTTDNNTISGTFVTSNIFKMGQLKKVRDEFVEYINNVIQNRNN